MLETVHLCAPKIENCEEYDAEKQYQQCKKCSNTYHFLEEDRLHCRNDLNDGKHYSKDILIMKQQIL